jgi:hypothetical protein
MELSMMHDYRIQRISTRFVSTSIASALWLLFWTRVLLDLYQADLKNVLTFSDRVQLPFTNFDEFIQQLRSVIE